MAKENALSIMLHDGVTQDKLAEVLDGVIENIQVSAVSEAIKAKNGSGDPISGSVEYKRFENATLNDKGTARTAGAGSKIKATPVIVNIDTNKEIVEEVAQKDIKLYGVDGVAERRKENHAKRTKAYLDTVFFNVSKNAGTQVNRGTLTDETDIIDAIIVKAKETSSNFIDGIDAEDLCIVVNGKYRKALKKKLDELPNGTVPQNGAIGMYDSIETYESNRLPAGVNCFVMLKGAVAQPYFINDYDMEKIPLDDNVALELFLYCGTKALVSEAIYYDAESVSV